MKRRPYVELAIWLLFAAVWGAHWNDHQPWGALAVLLTVGGLVRAALVLARIVREARVRRA